MQACREVYRDKCHDFAKLAELQPSLASHLVWLPPRDESASPSSAGARRATIDFAREESVEELTRCILRQDFGISWERPPRSLIPPVPNRLTYLLWLRDLVLSTKPSDGEGGVRGVDVGTGGTLIYPLLGASAFGWTFLATESCEYSLGWAERNRASNAGVKDLITVRDSKGGVLLGVVDEGARYDFCMCNPPFFDVTEERSLHKPGHGGLENELRCPGGEAGFVGRMISDSLVMKGQVLWYTTMIGRKKTLKALLARLRGEKDVKGIRTTTFVCGRTTRWGLAWTLTSVSVDLERVKRRKTRDAIAADGEESDEVRANKARRKQAKLERRKKARESEERARLAEEESADQDLMRAMGFDGFA
ncbi:S-adenosyl-L-methionine dependent methyltransferase [Chloropicon primus]|uniref:U6 small nuclear RNA (adenine-(43)-N(6))-methyltransferase n=2 Tax=Chloropicon primus TaxID=1764295 RepID=A0A5B8MFM0_9CHLO|nr:S-adenosyl-L-methionine dependent methyltransferase [Chloropicon primus]UPQ98492.1 S-adenosyl-L-methionine dependent methyltransferase [Chloropicon primus]|eukprot:QDZ19283.1 S-adenosyl-L-methionine dependent methyltransferase [Chloropicon primus]